MNYFFRDTATGKNVSWNDLICDLKEVEVYNKFCFSESYYEIFKQIIISIILDEEIVLLDSDFKESELLNLTGFSSFDVFNKRIDCDILNGINNKAELIEKIKKSTVKWKIQLFTSGTTGLPKKAIHSFASITRLVKYTDKSHEIVWGFAYNPTHMAGLQVFFQALLNGNTIIRLFGLSPKEIFSNIEEFGITHISATPTFFRMLLPCNCYFPKVKKITTGGEKFNSVVSKDLKNIFFNASITNIYASTEAGSILVSNNDIFTIKDDFKQFIKIIDNELLIHFSMMGVSETSNDEWYFTGDLVDIISDNPLSFKFTSRKNEMINVGGYKVNPNEIEEYILLIPGIKLARVFAKSNSVLGNIICCDVVKIVPEISEIEIREFLKSKIQPFKIPRIISFVESIQITRTGKTKRS